MKKRKSISYSFQSMELTALKTKMLNWLRPFSIFAYLDNNQYRHKPNRFELLVGCDAREIFNNPGQDTADWMFGHAAYDLKNTITPQLNSKHAASQGFDDFFFFRPEIVAYIPFGTHTLHIETISRNPEIILNAILNQDHAIEAVVATQNINWQFQLTPTQYLDKIKSIQKHIEEGDCYELNYCVEAFIPKININPYAVFHRLNTLNPSPFAALYRNRNAYSIGASPERFIYKQDRRIIAQPIKGTIEKGENKKENADQKRKLFHDEKERAENVMIVDLVRNDLAQCCEPASIKVSELFGVYAFPQLYHLISTIEGQLLEHQNLWDILKVTFPMGSMTGAPKRIVMELIEACEVSRRGLYSGTIGYNTPNGNFDFNVVIRSLFYNEQTQYLSYQAGGAITYDSIPEKEWEEVKLKAKAMESIFN